MDHTATYAFLQQSTCHKRNLPKPDILTIELYLLTGNEGLVYYTLTISEAMRSIYTETSHLSTTYNMININRQQPY